MRGSTNGDRIRCYKCSDHNHFAKEYLTSKVEKESDQVQQMSNMDEEQTTLKLLVTDTYDSFNRINNGRNTNGPIKLVKGKNGPTTFLPLNTKVVDSLNISKIGKQFV